MNTRKRNWQGLIPHYMVQNQKGLEVLIQQTLDPLKEQPRELLFLRLDKYKRALHSFRIAGTRSIDLLASATQQLPKCDTLEHVTVVHLASTAYARELVDLKLVSELNLLLTNQGFSQFSHEFFLVKPLQVLLVQPQTQHWWSGIVRAWGRFWK